MGDLFGDSEPAGFQFQRVVQCEPVSVLAALNTALPLAHFLVAFARYQRGKFDAKRHKVISLAIQERVAPVTLNPLDVIEWFTTMLPKASDLYEPIETLAARLQPEDIRIARRGALNITGSSQSEVGLACLALIERLFPQ